MILVTGDVVLDHNIYVGERSTPESKTAVGTRHGQQPGGGMLTYELLRALTMKGSVAGANEKALSPNDLAFGLGDMTVQTLANWPAQFRFSALWESFHGKTGNEAYWRLSRSLGYGTRTDSPYPAQPATALSNWKPRVLVIDDGGLGFRLRTAHHCWPSFLHETTTCEELEWIVLKMSRPLAQGDLWRELTSRWSDSLILIVSADDLRREDIRVSKGLSWESTVDDLLGEVELHPALRGMQSCRHLVITLHGDGALWLEYPGKLGQERCKLLFDRQRGEGEREDSNKVGAAYGYLSTVTAALALHLWRSDSKGQRDLTLALNAGLSATRFLSEFGHGPVKADEPGFPFREVAAHLLNPTNRYGVTSVSTKKHMPGPLVKTPIPGRWTILGNAFSSATFPGPLFGPARRLALLGPVALGSVPYARFGVLLTMDRHEIDALRSLRQMMVNYRDGGPQKRPLSLAVFGAPGSGKSFSIKQIALGVFGDKNPILEFNLAQFRGPDDLIGAYHLVRDHVLAGKTPVVFWDEFDSRNYFWLQYFLSPMQDGTFQEGQQSHVVGKSIFVFAGGTSRDFAHFGPVWERNEQETEAQRKVRHDFVMSKGPDFQSRVEGFLDVLGPNPRQVYDLELAKRGLDPWKDDPADIEFPVRRAVLLRSLLGFVGANEDQVLKIDPGLLTALLEVNHYRNGARSLEKLVTQIRDRGGSPLSRSALPPDHLFALYIAEPPLFEGLIRRSYDFLAQAERIAPILHDDYRNGLPVHEKGGRYDVPYDALDREGKAANLAAASRIPETLALAGFTLVEGHATEDEEVAIRDFLELHRDILAEAEHDGWEEQRRLEGWSYGKVRDDAARKHPMLVHYSELAEEQKDKDRRTIMNYPKYARAAGFKIATKSPNRVGESESKTDERKQAQSGK